MIMDICIYTMETCPRCEMLKQFMDDMKLPYKTMLMDTPEAITDMRVEGCFAMEAPVLQLRLGERFLFLESNQLFPNGELDRDLVKAHLVVAKVKELSHG